MNISSSHDTDRSNADSWQKEKDVTLTNKRFSSILRANADLIRCVQYRGTVIVRLIQLSDHDEGTLAESLVGSAWKDEFEKTQSYDRAIEVMRNAMAKPNILPRNDRELFIHHDGRASTATANRMAKRNPIIALRMFRTVKAATAAVVTTIVHAQPEESQVAVSQESAEALRAIAAPHMSANMSTTRSTAPAVIPSAKPSTASLSLATASGTFVSDSGTQEVTPTPLSTIKTNSADMFVFTAGGTPLVKTSARTNKIRAELEAKGYVDKVERSTATKDPDTSAKRQTAPSSDSPEFLPLTKSSSPAYTSVSAQTPTTSPMAVGSVGKEKSDITTVQEEAQNAATSKDIFRKQQNKEHERGTLDNNKENERGPDVAVEGL